MALPSGIVLTAVPQGYVDDEQDPEGEHVFQWYRTQTNVESREAIEGANASTYVVQRDDDHGYHIIVGVKPVSSSGHPSIGVERFAITAPTVNVGNTAPTLGSVRVEGSPTVGGVVRAVAEGYSDAEGDLAGSHTHSWFTATDAAGTQGKIYIAGANQDTLTVRSEDVGRYLFAQIKPTSQTGMWTGSPVVGSAGLVEGGTGSAPEITDVTIDGTLQTWQTLTATANGYTDADQDPEGTHLYKWYTSADAAGTTDLVAIDGAEQQTYELHASDQGRYVHVDVTPRSQSGSPNTGEVKRATRGPVLGQAPTAEPIITGELQVGVTLSVHSRYNDEDGDEAGQHLFQWYRQDDAAGTNRAEIPGADVRDYLVTSADLGKFLAVRVTPVSLTGNPNTGTPVFDVAPFAVTDQVYVDDTDHSFDNGGSGNISSIASITVTGRTGNASANATVTIRANGTFSYGHFELRAPDGTRRDLNGGAGLSGAHSIDQSYVIDLSSEPIEGTWTLGLRSMYHSAGDVDRWSISF
jgi:hypothetical protein